MDASIDIGTNTVLLLIANQEGSKVNVIHEQQRIPRLGQGVDQAKNLSDDAMEGVINAIKDYQRIIDKQFPEVGNIRVAATSAVRDAKNKEEFQKRVSRKTGLDLHILSGAKEAQYMYLGALSVLPGYNFNYPKVVIDIGGGSTEVAIGKGKEIIDYHSFDMGCVRFTERYLFSDPPGRKEIASCKSAIQNSYEGHEFHITLNSNTPLIGVSGTVTSLAYIDLQLECYDSEKIKEHRLSVEGIQQYIYKFSRWTSTRLTKKYPRVMEGRADIFLAGLLILESFMKKYGFNEIKTSTGGIKHGVIIDL